ncbi:hypothetical protein Btru_025634 [Bulinus truncatus]|nr:hypothetical protein Btru_025634 [Bulinus truncatus]
MNLPIHFLILLAFVSPCFCTKYLLTVPKEPTYDTNLTVTVTALSAPEKLDTVVLKFHGLKDKSKVLSSTDLTFHKNIADTKNWTVVFTWEHMLELEESGVLLSMESDGIYEELSLKFRESSGYIFIQTDKPIYTPGQKVQFRVIAVDEYQRLAKYPIKVDIKNHQGIIVERMRFSAVDAFKRQEFDLPRETSPGMWNISANFEGLGHSYSGHSVSFEVREYVLPRFSAIFKIDTDVITMDTNWIRMNVTAKYVYGLPVVGSVVIHLGTWSEDSSITMLPHAVYRGELSNGVYKKDITRSSLFTSNISIDSRQRLYVQVNVTERATQETVTIEDTSTFITHPYYEVDFKPSKLYFKPGFPYTVQVQVKAKSGRPASWVYLLLHPNFYDQEGKYLRDLSRKDYIIKLDMYGKHRKELDMPVQAELVSFSAKVMDFEKIKYIEYVFNVSNLHAKNEEYIHIFQQSAIQKFRPGVIELRYTKPQYDDGRKITLLVLSKGYIIHTDKNIMRNSDGLTKVYLPSKLLGEASPSMRIVAYFQGLQDIVMDSLLVDAPVKYCFEELSIHKPGLHSWSRLKPKDRFSLNVRGGSKMRVGFVAVDKAVLLLNDRQTLTRKLLFDELEKHDQGSDSRNDSSYEVILKDTGLQFILLDNSPPAMEEEPPKEGQTTDEKSRPSDASAPDLFMVKSVFHAPPSAQPPVMHPPQSVRNYFPESWMFEEHELHSNGILSLNWTLPDSITTWSILAVGLSSNRGVCVSEPVEQEVQKMFFADVRMPYKATRLEEVKIRIAIYNYHVYTVAVHGIVTSDAGLCLSSAASPTFNSGTTQTSVTFAMNISATHTGSEIIKVIPLKVGELTLRVHIKTHSDEDIVEKKLYVVSEGLKVRKTITFVLDPEAKHTTFHSRVQSVTIKNFVDKDNKLQQTTIDLALPTDVIKGTEFCGISAFGDLMGDIITHGVVRYKSLIDQSLVNAEEVIGDLGPAVYALLYVTDIGLIDDELKKKGIRFLKHGITRLLKYRKGQAFSLQSDSPPATWLTAAALKILCHATNQTFVDKANLIDSGFNWLLNRIEDDGSLLEEDWRLHQIDHNTLLDKVANFIEVNLDNINSSLVLAKAAYALKLLDEATDETAEAIRKLNDFKKKDKLNRFYWSDIVIDSQPRQPIWYHKKPTANAIEATSYALLVFLNHGLINEDAIADWLVSQRNPNGAFIGAMDSTAAIQALSEYSQKKYLQAGHAILLHGNISSDRALNYSHSFKFTEKNATSPASVKDVPVGQTLKVFTEGHGLGQMQVNVEYNIPIEKNVNCHYNVTLEVKPTEIRWNYPNSNPLCQSCNIGCPQNVIPLELVEVPPIAHNSLRIRATTRGNFFRTQQRKRRNTPIYVASKKSICIHVCLRYLRASDNVPINVKVGMLTGYRSVTEDLNLIKSGPNVLQVEYQHESETLIIQLAKVDTDQPMCFGFRAIDEEEVERQVPAPVVIQPVGYAEPACTLDYHPPASTESLKVFCADFSHINRGECRCYSGLCGRCRPAYKDELDLDKTKKLACEKKIAYQLRLTDVKDQIDWMEIDANVLSLNKTGSHQLQEGSTIKMMSPSSCSCLVNDYRDKNFYMLSSDVERLVDRRGNPIYRYLLDENSNFLHVTEPEISYSGKYPLSNYLFHINNMKSPCFVVVYCNIFNSAGDVC